VLVDTASHRTSAAVLIDCDRGKINLSPFSGMPST